jgi:hypothetical protein
MGGESPILSPGSSGRAAGFRRHEIQSIVVTELNTSYSMIVFGRQRLCHGLLTLQDSRERFRDEGVECCDGRQFPDFEELFEDQEKATGCEDVGEKGCTWMCEA